MQLKIENSYILLADDDMDDRYMFNDAFARIGWADHIRLFESGESMTRYLNNLPGEQFFPALIVMDYYMPKFTGEDILKQLKQSDYFKTIPVVIYSSQMCQSLKEKLTCLGAKYCYQKIEDSVKAIQFAKALKQFSEQALSESGQKETLI